MRRASPWILIMLVLALSIFKPVLSKNQPNYCQCPPDPLFALTKNPHFNETVLELQRYWATKSLYKGNPNGLFDRTMEVAVLNFQKLQHLNTSGRLDPETWQRIGSLNDTTVFSNQLPAGPVEIVVDLNALSLTVLVDREPFRTFPVAIGKVQTPSPAGSWKVTHQGYWAKGKTSWIGLSVPFGRYGIHGTNQPWSIGRRASNGCIRMFNHHLELVYRWVKPGTPVHIVGNPFRDQRLLKRGLVGSDVYFLQLRLKQLGYFQKTPNGHFDYWTEKALRACQTELGLEATGEFTAKEYWKLKLYPTD